MSADEGGRGRRDPRHPDARVIVRRALRADRERHRPRRQRQRHGGRSSNAAPPMAESADGGPTQSDDDLTLGPGAKISRPRRLLLGGPASTIAPGQLLAPYLPDRGAAGARRHGRGRIAPATRNSTPPCDQGDSAGAGGQHAHRRPVPSRSLDSPHRPPRRASSPTTGVFRDENGRIYLVMEFVDGPSLSKLMQAGRAAAGSGARVARPPGRNGWPPPT